MVLINRLIPWVVSFLTLVLVEQIFLAPHQIQWLSGYLVATIVLSIWQLTGRRLRSVKFWRYLMTPLLFTVIGLLFLSFLKASFVRQIALLAYAIAVWVYLEIIFLRFNFRPKYQIHALENIFTHLELVTVFLAATSFFAVSVFLGIQIWMVTVGFAVMVMLFSYQVVWTSDANFVAAWPYAAVVVLTMTEIFFAVGYLPTSVYVGGMIVGTSYYLITGLTRNWLLGNREWRVVQRYVYISVAVVIATLTTARWF